MANFENITIEKGMYQTKGGISGALEKLGAGGEHETGAKQLFDAISNSARAVNDKENGN